MLLWKMDLRVHNGTLYGEWRADSGPEEDDEAEGLKNAAWWSRQRTEELMQPLLEAGEKDDEEEPRESGKKKASGRNCSNPKSVDLC